MRVWYVQSKPQNEEEELKVHTGKGDGGDKRMTAR